MLGASAMLRDPRLAAERRDGLIEVQHQGADMLLALLNDVLDLSRLEAGKLVLEHRPLRLHELVAQLRTFFAPQADAKGIELTSSTSPDVPELLLGDSTRVRQIVANLVSNAIKFTVHGGVQIRLGLDGARWGRRGMARRHDACARRGRRLGRRHRARRRSKRCSSRSSRPTRRSRGDSAVRASGCRSPTNWPG